MLKKIAHSFLHLLALFIVCALCFTVSSAGESLITEEQIEATYSIDYYEYPVLENWDAMTVRERVEALVIPEETLNLMSDAALIQAIADYPYLVDIYLYGGDLVTGIEIAREYFSALNEFLNRSSAAESLQLYHSNLSSLSVINGKDAEASLDSVFLTKAMRDIQSVLSLQANTTRILDATDLTLDGEVIKTGYVYTPRGSQVSMDLYIDISTEAERNALDAEIIATYNVELVSEATHTYNCHSYAWHMCRGGIACWISNPSPYMDDGSYVRNYSGVTSTPSYQSGALTGDIVLYNNQSHSAIIIGSTWTGAPLSSVLCESKWTAAGVFRHSLGNVPAGYDISTITIWRED